MKIWVDDVRPPPGPVWTKPGDFWVWKKTSQETIDFLDYWWSEGVKFFLDDWTPPELVSLDHDLGGDDTTRPIVLWMIENDRWPVEVRVHSANPVGIDWLEGMIGRYKPS